MESGRVSRLGLRVPLVRDEELQKYLSKLLSWIQKFELNYIHQSMSHGMAC
jgi:hypothetical protein